MIEDLSYTLTLRLKKNIIFFGPGVVKVLTLVEQHGSLSTAAREMNMSYNKAWRIVKRAEDEWGAPLLKSSSGGSNGGGSKLTEDARELIGLYHEFAKRSRKLVDECFNDVFGHYAQDKKAGNKDE